MQKLMLIKQRIFIFPENFDEALKIIKNFWISFFLTSVATHTTFDEIEDTLSKYVDELEKNGLINKNTKFAIRCRRVGIHDFSSQRISSICWKCSS